MTRAAQSNWQCGLRHVAVVTGFAVALAIAARSAHAGTSCVGDCDGSANVPVNELITMVNIALGNAQLSICTAGDGDGSGTITVDEIITAVNNALNGCAPPAPRCGDGVVNADEECDDGGVCIGGTDAGAHCMADMQCHGEGVCVAGMKNGAVCSADADCPGGQCVHCKTVGGDGCATNCTMETVVPISLVPGVLEGADLAPGTSGATVYADILTIPFPLSGNQTLAVGKERDGHIPVVVKLNGLPFPRIPASTLACACVRGVAYKTCGGTLLETDGTTPASNCTPLFTAGDQECTGKKPCTFVFGEGNSGVGMVGCNGLPDTDYTTTQDAGGTSGIPGPRITTSSGSGGPGAAIVESTNAIATVQPAAGQIDPCSVTPGERADQYGPDGQFCTDDDPPSAFGTTVPTLSVTGTATAQLLNANGADSNNVGPVSLSGAPFSCSALSSSTPSTAGAALASAGPLLGQPTVGDVVVTTLLVAQ